MVSAFPYTLLVEFAAALSYPVHHGRTEPSGVDWHTEKVLHMHCVAQMLDAPSRLDGSHDGHRVIHLAIREPLTNHVC